MQRVQPRPSIQPIIKFIFSPRFVGLETCDKVRRLFLFPISKQNKNLGFSHVKSGNPDTSRYFVLSGRSAVVSDYAANFSQTKKNRILILSTTPLGSLLAQIYENCRQKGKPDTAYLV